MKLLLGLTGALLAGCWSCAAGAGEDSAAAPKVRPDRPRVFIRAKAWEGPSVEKLREFMKLPEFQRMSAKLPNKIGNAVKFLAGDDAAGEAAVADLKKMDIHGDSPSYSGIGGDGYEFWAGGANQPPSKRGKDFVDKPDDGNWRVEVSPAKPSGFDNFLLLIDIGDTAAPEPPAGAAFADADGKMAGLAVGGWAVMFGTKGAVDGEVTYQAPTGAVRHLVMDLARGGRYVLSGAGSEKTLNASPEGVLDFPAPAGARLTLKPVRQ